MPTLSIAQSDAKWYMRSPTAIKAQGDGRIGGYLVVWGTPQNKDSQGEYFTPETNFELDWYDKRPVLYHHGLNGQVQSEDIGTIVRITPDEHGLWADAQLDLSNPYGAQVYAMTERGELGWSSGSLPHLVESDDDGRLVKWPIVEGSLTPTPAEPYRTRVRAVKSLNELIPLTADENGDTKEPTAKEFSAALQTPQATKTVANSVGHIRTITWKSETMDLTKLLAVLDAQGISPEQQLAIVREFSGGAEPYAEGTMADPAPEEDAALVEDPMKADAAPEDETVKAKAAKPQTVYVNAKDFAAEVNKQWAKNYAEAIKAAPALDKTGGQGVQRPRGANISVGDTKYRDLKAADMAFLEQCRRMYAQKSGNPYDADVSFYREMLDKAQKEYGTNGLDLTPEDGRRLMAVKANELDNTANATAAGNWVPTLWSNDLWRRVRVDNDIARQFRIVEMPSQVYELPVESTDPTIYLVPETTAEAQLLLDGAGSPIPDSVVQALKTTLTAKKLGGRVGFSAEIVEDSIIQFIPQLREQMLRSMQNAIDYVCVNGDTETGASTNINAIDATPAATDKFLIFNGLRKLPLVTNTALAFDAGGGDPTLQLIRQARFAMRSTTNVYANRPQDLVIFVDVPTYGRMLNIDELLVYMNNGRGSTVNDGVVPMIDGIPVFASAEISLANTAGKVAVTTPANNTTGTLVIAAKPGWYLGYRRQVTSTVDFLSYYDSYQMTATARLAFINKDTVASAVIYNIGIG